MHRSGISVSDELKKKLTEAGEGGVGYVKVRIENETFVIKKTGKSAGSFERDLDKARQEALEEKEVTYVLVRSSDKAHPDKLKWVVVFFVPEGAPVKDKMLYASSRASLKEGFGLPQFREDFNVSTIKECTFADFEHQTHKEGGVDVMTQEEQTKLEAMHDSVKTMTGSVKMAAMNEIPISIADSTTKGIQKFVEGGLQALLLMMDEGKEELQLEHGHATEEKLDISNFATHRFPPKHPRYAVFRYKHDNDGEKEVANVFVYYCPDSAVPKQKMIYSTCRNTCVAVLTQNGLNVAKSIEISDAKELTDAALLDELYPKNSDKKKFGKPKRQGKGNARLLGKFDPNA